jgi:hypothetical protein
MNDMLYSTCGLVYHKYKFELIIVFKCINAVFYECCDYIMIM